MSLLVVSHSYVLSNARGKIRQLKTPLFLIVPREWPFEFLTASAEPEPNSDIKLIPIRVLLGGRVIRFIFSPPVLVNALRKIRPKVVLVEEEPNSLALAQFSMLKRRFSFRLLAFTWENIRRRPLLTGAIEKLNLKNTDGMIAGTDGAAGVIRHKGYEGPISVIPQMGVGPEFSPSKMNTGGQSFVLGYVGRLVEEKGLRLLFKTIEKLPGEWELHVVGNGPLRPELEEIAVTGGFRERVRFMDFIPRDDLPSALRGFDLFVLPSISIGAWKEQFGRVLIEAMACGVPVIGSSCGAIPEVIGDAGLIFKEGDSNDLNARIMELMSDPNLRTTFAKRGLERVQAMYADEVIADKLTNFIQEVAE